MRQDRELPAGAGVPEPHVAPTDRSGGDKAAVRAVGDPIALRVAGKDLGAVRVATSQSRTVPSRLLEASSVPAGLKAARDPRSRRRRLCRPPGATNRVGIEDTTAVGGSRDERRSVRGPVARGDPRYGLHSGAGVLGLPLFAAPGPPALEAAAGDRGPGRCDVSHPGSNPRPPARRTPSPPASGLRVAVSAGPWRDGRRVPGVVSSPPPPCRHVRPDRTGKSTPLDSDGHHDRRGVVRAFDQFDLFDPAVLMREDREVAELLIPQPECEERARHVHSTDVIREVLAIDERMVLRLASYIVKPDVDRDGPR